MKCCCNSNSTQYERNGWFAQLVFALDWKVNGAKLPSVGLWLNASKSESMLESNDFYLFKFQSNTIRLRPKIIPDGSCFRRRACCSPCKLIEIFEEINPLQTTENGRGIVSIRVALLLRTTEIKPCSSDLSRLYVSYDMGNSPSPIPSASYFSVLSLSLTTLTPADLK